MRHDPRAKRPRRRSDWFSFHHIDHCCCGRDGLDSTRNVPTRPARLDVVRFSWVPEFLGNGDKCSTALAKNWFSIRFNPLAARAPVSHYIETVVQTVAVTILAELSYCITYSFKAGWE